MEMEPWKQVPFRFYSERPGLAENLWRCVMPFERRSISEESQEAGLGSLRGCLVEGDAEQRNRERRIRRRALVISVLVQSAMLTLLVLVQLFGKTQRIVFAVTTPIPPYAPYHGSPRDPGAPHPSRGPQTPCHFCPPPSIPRIIVTRDLHPEEAGSDDPQIDGLVPGIPGVPGGIIPIPDSRSTIRPPDSDHHDARPSILHRTHLDPAMLVRRVEPKYPELAKQTHREGRVELRAIIGTDGSIQSLQVIAGDPLFIQSALDAVEQWHYKPTYLNGQPVEIDTYITVVYTMQH
jgi:protein TonB